MRTLILILLVGTVVVLCRKDLHINLDDAPELFEKFIKDYKRVYKDDEDRKIHYEAFKTNLKKINKSNQDNPLAEFGITQFADYTEEEWRKMG